MNLFGMKQRIWIIGFIVACIGLPEPIYAMNNLKGWVNKIKPGTFATTENTQSGTKGDKGEAKFTDADVKVLTQLKVREAQLEKRELEFSKRTGELKLLSQQIEQKLDQMRSLAGKIEAIRDERKKMDERDVSRMVKYYETMTPDNTAAFINKMDRLTAMQILMRMNPRKASAVMQLLDPKVAVEITERVTRFKSNRADLVGK